MVSVTDGQGRIQGGRMRGMHSPTSHFQKCFWCIAYNFSIISNLFDSNKPFTPARKIENVRTKCIAFGEALVWVKKIKQNLPENCSKSTIIAISACEFSNLFRGSKPADPPRAFLFLNQLKIYSAEKTRLKKERETMPPSRFKISHYAANWKFLLFFANKNFSIYSNLLFGG